MSDPLQHAENQMLMQRPWDAAGPDEIWVVTGAYPKDHPSGSTGFSDVLVMTLPMFITGTERPAFLYIHPGLTLAGSRLPDTIIDPAWITHGQPLLLVHRDNPTVAYWATDQAWIEAAQ